MRNFSCIWILFIVLIACAEKKTNKMLTFDIADKEHKIIRLTSRACYWSDVNYIKKEIDVNISPPTQKEVDEVKSILEYVGLPANFKLIRGNVDNALATMYEGERLIIYNKDLFSSLDADTTFFWSSMFVIAHEIGHHLAYNISDTSNSLNSELDADIFAASVLFKMGADSIQTLAAVKSSSISNMEDTQTHPAKSKRIQTVSNSWLRASELRYTSAAPPDPGPWGKGGYSHDVLFRYSAGAFDTYESLKKNGNTSEGIEGIIQDVYSWDRDPLEMTSSETMIRVIVTKPGKNADTYIFGDEMDRLEIRVNHVGTLNQLKVFKDYLIPGRRMKFTLAHVRVGILYLMKTEDP